MVHQILMFQGQSHMSVQLGQYSVSRVLSWVQFKYILSAEGDALLPLKHRV